MSRRRSLTAALVASLLMVPLGVSHTASAGKPSDDGLSKDDHELLAIAAASGQSSVTLLIAAKGGAAKQVVNGVQALGGVVGYRDDALGYIRATVPTAKAESVASLAGVQAVDVDEVIPIPDPVPQGASDVRHRRPPPGAATPNNNPYMPTGDTGGAQFVAAHPTWDGRGVTVGIVDTGITLDHPEPAHDEHRRAQDRRLGDRHGSETDDNDPTWLNMQTQVSGADASRFDRRRLHGSGGRHVPVRALQRARPAARRRGRQRRQPRRQPGRVAAACSRVLWNTTIEQRLRRHQPEPATSPTTWR